MYRYEDPVMDANAYQSDLDDRPCVECSCCGMPLYAGTETADGDKAYYINGEWYCESCIEDFKVEVFV